MGKCALKAATPLVVEASQACRPRLSQLSHCNIKLLNLLKCRLILKRHQAIDWLYTGTVLEKPYSHVAGNIASAVW